MRALSWPTLVYLLLVVFAAVLSAATAIYQASFPSSGELALAALLGILALLVWLFPMPQSFDTRSILDTIVIVAAVLLLDMGIAILFVGLGALLAQVIQRRPWERLTFDTAQVVLQIAIGSWFLGQTSWDRQAPALNEPASIGIALACAFIILTANHFLVGTIVSLNSAINPLRVWAKQGVIANRVEVLITLAQVGIGIFIALIARNYPLLLPILALPVVALYAAGRQTMNLRRQAVEAQRLSEDALTEAQRVAHVGSWEWTFGSGLHVWSPETYRILGYDSNMINPSLATLLDAVHPEDRKRVDQAVRQLLYDGKPFDIEHRIVPHKKTRTVHHRGELILDDKGHKVRMITTIHDITERKILEDRLAFLAYHDSLTGLANRAQLVREIDAAMDVDQGLIGLLFIDIDHFKEVNDRFGHDIGDQFLISIAGRLRENIRGDDIPARLGGDEFTVLIPSLQTPETGEYFASRLTEALREPLQIDQHVLQLTTSIGVCVAEKSEINRQELVRRADIALYQAKRRGRNTYVMYEPGLHTPSEYARVRTIDLPDSAISSIERRKIANG